MTVDDITREMVDVWLLAEEILEAGPAAIDHTLRAGVSPRGEGAMRDWAIDYMRFVPVNKYHHYLLVKAHFGSVNVKTHPCANQVVSQFYREVEKRGLLIQGAGYLRRI